MIGRGKAGQFSLVAVEQENAGLRSEFASLAGDVSSVRELQESESSQHHNVKKEEKQRSQPEEKVFLLEGNLGRSATRRRLELYKWTARVIQEQTRML
jgi:hypothetical protein